MGKSPKTGKELEPERGHKAPRVFYLVYAWIKKVLVER